MKTVTISAVLALACVGVGAGQLSAQEIARATIPFSFVVRGREFPAGHYEISRNDDVLRIRGIDHPSGAFVLTNPAGGSDPAGNQMALVFTNYENEYQLSQVWESNREGFEVMSHAAAMKQANAGDMVAPRVVVRAGG